jgi:hypothetical protein
MDEVRNIHGVLQRLLDIADSQRPAGKEGSDPEPIAAANADGEIAPEFEGEDYDNDDSHDYGQYDDGDSYQDEDIDAEADFDDHDIDWGDKYD